MPVSVSQLISDVATTVLDLGDGATITLKYAPTKVSPNTLREMLSLDSKEVLEQVDVSVHMVKEFLVFWDLVEDKAHPADPDVIVPLTIERLSNLPTSFLQRVLEAIFSDMKVGEANGTTSSAA